MSIFKFFTKKVSKPQGLITYLSLADWWVETFTDEEKNLIEGRFQTKGGSFDSLTKGKVSYSNERPLRFLSNLATWSIEDKSRSIAIRILDKAGSYVAEGSDLDIHFYYQSQIVIYYMDRDQPGFLDKVVTACRKQIALAPKAATAFKSEYQNNLLPSHKGYNQLTEILFAQGAYQEVVELCKQAKRQGWGGDWGKKLERIKKISTA